MPKMTEKTKPVALSVEMRLAVLEKSMQDLHSAMCSLHVLRTNPSKLPVMPEGSGMKLSETRRKAGWPARVLAKALRVSPSTLSMWELEKLAIPRWRAEAIIDVFNRSDVEPPFSMPAFGEDDA
jgi:DNA-binding transcriptional regulator YiaG